jgi:hypothetical protein
MMTSKDQPKDHRRPNRSRNQWLRDIHLNALFYLILLMSYDICTPAAGVSGTLPFTPGEKLTYVLRWENIPAGEAEMKIEPIESVNGEDAYYFVMKTRTNDFVDVFFKVRERIDAYADIRMGRSLSFRKTQTEGEHKRDERIDFDWTSGTAQHSNYGQKSAPIPLEPGSLDPLSVLYYTRMALSEQSPFVERLVTDGKKSFIGRADLIRRETITLTSGKTFDTFCVVPRMGDIGGVFQGDKDARIHMWVTADDKRLPVRIMSKLAIGHFVGELTGAEGLRQ